MNDLPQPAPNCDDDTDVEFISIGEARETIFAAARPRAVAEVQPLQNSLGRVAAQDLAAPIDVPRKNNSAMDGFAVNSAGAGVNREQRFREIGTALAGQPFTGTVAPGECVRITTGAWVPDGADTIVIQEQSISKDGEVVCLADVKCGMNVREAGEDIKAGTAVVERGTRLWPAHVGLLGSLGMAELPLFKPPRVAYFSTGDEVRSLGELLPEGAIYDSNRHTVLSMARRLGIDTVDLGVVPDEPRAMRETFVEARAQADVIITTGGVSVGEADYIKPVLRTLGDARFWKVAVRPGRPFTFGLLGETLFFGLPGNPVATMVMFYQLVQPTLRHLGGESQCLPLELLATCQSSLRKRPGRMEFQRGVLSHGPGGELLVHKTGMQGSGILSSMAQADCFIVLDDDDSTIEPGAPVKVQPFYGLM